MKYCPNCHLTYDDTVNVCGQCGANLQNMPQPQQVFTNPNDHTAEFSAEDISQNKVLAMVPYLLGIFGIIISLLASGTSPYAAFHVKQALKIYVVQVISVVLCIIPILGWIVAGIWSIISLVITVICFIQVCKGEAKEPAIICNFKFLK